MRILVLNYEFPPVGGGGGRASAELAQALVERGHEIRVLTSSGVGLPNIEQRDGYLVRRVPTGRRSHFRASLRDMAAYIAFGLLPGWRLIRRWKPDLLHAHFAVPTGVLANWLARLSRVPYVLTVHLGDVPGGVPEKTGRWFRWVYRWTPRIWREAAAVVAVSRYTRDLALQHYDVPIQVIPNAIQLPPERELPLSVGEPPRLIFAGRFQPQKDLPLLVEALAAIQDLEWRCVLVGDGPQAETVDRLIRSEGLEPRVERTGWLDREAVVDRLRGSDILVMPSRSEGLPVVGIEALAHGLAIVATRAGGLSELVEDGSNGRLCEIGDRGCLIESLRWCLADRGRLLELKRASRRLAARYDTNVIAGQYESLFSEVAAQ